MREVGKYRIIDDECEQILRLQFFKRIRKKYINSRIDNNYMK